VRITLRVHSLRAKKGKSAAKSADELLEANITRLEETIKRLPESLATQEQLESTLVPDINQKEFGPLIKDTATRYNVPLSIVTALLSVENAQLNPNAQGPVITSGSHKGDRAHGLFQLMEKTARGLGVDRKDVAGNIEGGIKLLAENFQRTGNWRDAISMYHSGVTYDEAKNRSDGNMKTVDYVARILERAGV
jgi:soluble lytic murein transglycosylase-like protein